MPRKVKVPKAISRAIGQFGLSRPLINQLENIIHEGTPLADPSRRWPEDQRCFSFQVSITHDGNEYFFVLVVDDTTSPDHLIIQNIGFASFGDL